MERVQGIEHVLLSCFCFLLGMYGFGRLAEVLGLREFVLIE